MAKDVAGKIKRSAVIRALSHFADAAAKRAKNSLLARLFSGYFALEKMQLSSFAATAASKKTPLNAALSRLRDAICRFFTGSRAKNAVTSFLSELLYVRTRDVGIYLFSSGLYAVIEYFIIKYALVSRDLPVTTLYGGAAVLVLSLFFLSGRPLSATLCRTPVLSFFTLGVLGADEEKLTAEKEGKKRASTALLAGMLTGVAAFVAPPHRVLLFLFCIIILCVVFFKPEPGAVLTVAAVPFLPLREVLILCAVTTASYVLKTIRRKRELRFRPVDVSVMILAVFTFLGKLVTAGDASSSGSLFLLGLSGYFICRNLLCKREWLDRTLHAAALSAAAVSVFGLFFYFCGTPSQMLAARSLFAGEGGRMALFFDSPQALASYLLIGAPLLLYFALDGRNGKLAYIFAYAASLCALCLTGSFYAAAVCVITSVFMAVLRDRRAAVPVVISLPFAALVCALIPGGLYSKLYSLLYTENALIGSVWRGVAGLIRSSPLFGYGIGSFRYMYPNFALQGFDAVNGAKSVYLQICAEGGITAAVCFAVFLLTFFSFCVTCIVKCGKTESKRYIYAPFAAVLSVSLYGLVENVFSSPAVCLLTFAVAGIGSAAAELCRREHDYAVTALEYTEG